MYQQFKGCVTAKVQQAEYNANIESTIEQQT